MARVEKLAVREGDRVQFRNDPVLGTVVAVGPHAVLVKWDDGVENSVRLDDPSLSFPGQPRSA